MSTHLGVATAEQLRQNLVPRGEPPVAIAPLPSMPARAAGGTAATRSIASRSVGRGRCMTSTPRVIEATAVVARGGPAIRSVAGGRRALLYLLAASTGLRAKECSLARRADFGPGLAQVRVAGEFTKNGKEAVQPIPSFLRPALAAAVAGLADGDFLRPGGWRKYERSRWAEEGWVAGKRGGRLPPRGAAWAGIAIGRSGMEANGGHVLDFHSFRHSDVSSLDRAGLSEGLARAASRAILERYTHREFGELAAVVESLPTIGVPAAGPGEAGGRGENGCPGNSAELGWSRSGPSGPSARCSRPGRAPRGPGSGWSYRARPN